MKKFLEFVGFLFVIFISGLFFLVSFELIFVKHNYDLVNWFFLFAMGGFTFFLISGTIAWIVCELKKTDNPETENLKTDNPENDEIITVTEIKGVKKIIKNGKVIYCEELKADELKVFENLKDKN